MKGFQSRLRSTLWATAWTPWILLTAVHATEGGAPKYGPHAKPLSARTHIAYFQKETAPDFWRLIPYYLPQETQTGCSAANITMILNAARSKKASLKSDWKSDEKLLTFQSFAKDYAGDSKYSRAILGKFFIPGKQFANSNLARVLENASKKLGLHTDGASVIFHEIDPSHLADGKKRFLEALQENEKTDQDFIFFSYIQGKVTGDPEGGAHVATIAAYDQKTQSVLIMDSDREWYEPYWTSVDILFEAISSPASDSEKRVGWIRYQLGHSAPPSQSSRTSHSGRHNISYQTFPVS